MSRFLFLLLMPVIAPAQQSDILLLQKNHRTIRQFFPGSTIEFFTTEHRGVRAVVDYIKKDSLFLLYYDVKMRPTATGGYMPDTLSVYHMNYSLANVYSFPADPRKLSFLTNGVLLMLGGGAYIVLNLVNTTREGDPPFGKDNLPNLVGGVAAFGLGLLLNKMQVKEYRLGKKYQLKCLPASAPAGK